jgi:hypothetical protein
VYASRAIGAQGGFHRRRVRSSSSRRGSLTSGSTLRRPRAHAPLVSRRPKLEGKCISLISEATEVLSFAELERRSVAGTVASAGSSAHASGASLGNRPLAHARKSSPRGSALGAIAPTPSARARATPEGRCSKGGNDPAMHEHHHQVDRGCYRAALPNELGKRHAAAREEDGARQEATERSYPWLAPNPSVDPQTRRPR